MNALLIILILAPLLSACGGDTLGSPGLSPQLPPMRTVEWRPHGLNGSSPSPTPEPPRQGTARDLAPPTVIDSSNATDNTITAAMLLTLSGRLAGLGQSMLAAGQLALFDLASPGFGLRPYDTRGTPDGAAAAAAQAMSDGADLIIGPLLGSGTAAVARRHRDGDVPVLSSSNDATLAGNGVFILGYLPDAEVERVLRYAAKRDLRRIALVLTPDRYGDLVADMTDRLAPELGLTIAGRRRLPAEADPQAIAAAMRQFWSTLGSQPDALFLPLPPRELDIVASTLPEPRPRLLGTALWSTGGPPPDSAIGGWYATAQPRTTTAFTIRFEDAYGHQPPHLAELAYDATAMAALAADAGSRIFADALVRSHGFTGAGGLFRLRRNGLVEWAMPVLEVSYTGPITLDPAPARFPSERRMAVRTAPFSRADSPSRR